MLRNEDEENHQEENREISELEGCSVSLVFYGQMILISLVNLGKVLYNGHYSDAG